MLVSVEVGLGVSSSGSREGWVWRSGASSVATGWPQRIGRRREGKRERGCTTARVAQRRGDGKMMKPAGACVSLLREDDGFSLVGISEGKKEAIDLFLT